ncbi:metallophosphoesterase [Haloplanus halophilus]|uniref:metallophosphoesterase n=1 Tax=Haloplanus halophilus TaxID=2949993 RepID=UPI00203F917E|nr:metallophosphoesterase [Haloplanus sp. GDY1]
MALVEPVPGAPAATADCGDERALVVADYHAGIEAGLRYERGVELRSDADGRRERLLALVERTDPDRVVVLGDLVHRIGDPGAGERDEVVALLDGLDVPLTLVPGNHDGGVADAYGDRIDVTDPAGVRRGDVGFVHGHTWPDRAVLGASTVCVGHEHPQVRLEDEVGGGRAEKAWLRGPLRIDTFADHYGVAPEALAPADHRPELVVFPAFNDRSGGTWINVEGQEFLAPFLPAGVGDADAYLLDGTRLGSFRRV